MLTLSKSLSRFFVPNLFFCFIQLVVDIENFATDYLVCFVALPIFSSCVGIATNFSFVATGLEQSVKAAGSICLNEAFEVL